MEDRIFDLCVIGAGLIGSAAARHGSIRNHSVCLLGPDESTSRQESYTFGAWHDEGRIVRQTDPSLEWAVLAKESVVRFTQIEKDAGVSFFNDVGSMMVVTASSAHFKNIKTVAEKLMVKMDVLATKDLSEKFPYLKFPQTTIGTFVKEYSGYISPRLLVKAQQKIAARNGCVNINDVAVSVTRVPGAGPSMEIYTKQGYKIRAHNVLLAIGSWTHLTAGIFPDLNRVPTLQNVTETVSKVEISKEDADRLKCMPSIVYKGPYWGNVTASEYTQLTLGSPVDHDNYSCYILPPILYPNGKCYIKIGHGDAFSYPVDTADQMRQWYRQGGGENALRMLTHEILTLIPSVRPLSVESDACCTVRTPGRLPYIDKVHDHLTVLAGGNGYAAKSSDELGRLGAVLATTGQWETTLDRDKFRLRYTSDTPSSRL